MINITPVYSKYMHRDLKKVALSIAVNEISNLQALDGNSSDKPSFYETMKKVNDFKYVADSVLYTLDKLLQSNYL